MSRFETLSEERVREMRRDLLEDDLPASGCPNGYSIHRTPVPAGEITIWRPSFARDVNKILYCPYYNRYADKTQVFSFFRNDDLTRRSLHVQLVSRIARTIGSALNLNLDLIEAISLGHDIGHTPFAHTGEVFLDQLYYEHAGRHFSHNIHSVRVLDKIFPYNLSLQVLSGIASHNGELELDEYRPMPLEDFAVFDREIEHCYEDRGYADKLIPSTLEGCVMRISDIIAFLGKDRQDAAWAKLVPGSLFSEEPISTVNEEIINNLVVNIIENSYGKPYIRMDQEHFAMLQEAKSSNYELIYKNPSVKGTVNTFVGPMMRQIYEQLLEDLRTENRRSPIFTHHIAYVSEVSAGRVFPYELSDPNDLVVDYIASMTDDYFIDLYHFLFPDSPVSIEYVGYFDKKEPLKR